MEKLLAWSRILFLLPVLALTAPQTNAQTAPPRTAPPQAVLSLNDIKSQADLDKTITALDAAVFDAYNRCDLDKFSTFFVDDVEFYHDQGGVTLGNKALTESVKKNICGGDVRRELVPGSLQVHYMKDYGAVEIGVHRFYHPKSNTPTGEGRFIQLWQYKGGTWKMTRVISFDHHQAAK